MFFLFEILKSDFRDFEKMSPKDQKAEYVSRAKLSDQAERYDYMAETALVIIFKFYSNAGGNLKF